MKVAINMLEWYIQPHTPTTYPVIIVDNNNLQLINKADNRTTTIYITIADITKCINSGTADDLVELVDVTVDELQQVLTQIKSTQPRLQQLKNYVLSRSCFPRNIEVSID